MGRMDLPGIANRWAGLDATDRPSVEMCESVSREDFRPRREAAWRKPAGARKPPAGCKPWDDFMRPAAGRPERDWRPAQAPVSPASVFTETVNPGFPGQIAFSLSLEANSKIRINKLWRC